MREEIRCPCGAMCWRDGLCTICGLPAGATDEHYDRLWAATYPRSDRLPFPPTGGRFSRGRDSARIVAALKASPAGLRMDELMHYCALSWDEALAAVSRGLDARALACVHLPDKRSQGEMVSGGTRYTLVGA